MCSSRQFRVSDAAMHAGRTDYFLKAPGGCGYACMESFHRPEIVEGASAVDLSHYGYTRLPSSGFVLTRRGTWDR
jgi:hypothetical protein